MEGTYDHSSNPDGRVCCLFSWVLNIKGFFSTAILSNILIVLVNIIKAVLSFHAKNCFTYLFCLSVFFYPPKHTSITNIKNLKRGGETVWEESTLAKIYMKFLVEKGRILMSPLFAETSEFWWGYASGHFEVFRRPWWTGSTVLLARYFQHITCKVL